MNYELISEIIGSNFKYVYIKWWSGSLFFSAEFIKYKKYDLKYVKNKISF